MNALINRLHPTATLRVTSDYKTKLMTVSVSSDMETADQCEALILSLRLLQALLPTGVPTDGSEESENVSGAAK